MAIPTRDTPTLDLIDRGFGGESTDKRAVADCMQLLRVSKALLGFFYERFASLGISPGKYSVLCELVALDEGESLSPSTLARRIGVTRPTITGLIDGLCNQGYVERRFDPDDRRRVAINISAEGRAFINELLPGQFAAMAEIVGGLSSAQRKSLRQSLGTMEEHLS